MYAVVRDSAEPVLFLDRSVGGRFKGRNPTVPLARLKAEWVEGVDTLYLGRAGSLRTRVDYFARFGRGAPIGHWGGRLIWQLADDSRLLIAWLVDDDPVNREAELVRDFVQAYGRLPFANLVQPRGLSFHERG